MRRWRHAAPMATPTSARASAGASLMPSPTMIVGPAGCSAGRPRPSPPVCARRARRRRRASRRRPPPPRPGRPVTITTRRMPSRRRRRIVRARRRGSGPRARCAGGRAVDLDAHRHGAVEPARRRPPAPTARSRAVVTHAALPTVTCRRRRPRTPVPATSSTSTRERELAGRAPSGAHHGRGEHMRRDLVERGGEPQHLVAVDAAGSGDTSTTSGRPAVSVPVLSKSSTVCRPALERAAALDDDTAPRGPGQPGDDRHRRGEDQRAWRRHDEHGDGTHRLARDAHAAPAIARLTSRKTPA